MKGQAIRTQTEAILIRFDPSHLKLVSEAANYLGLPRSAWMRATVLREARQILAEKAHHADSGRDD